MRINLLDSVFAVSCALYGLFHVFIVVTGVGNAFIDVGWACWMYGFASLFLMVVGNMWMLHRLSTRKRLHAALIVLLVCLVVVLAYLAVLEPETVIDAPIAAMMGLPAVIFVTFFFGYPRSPIRFVRKLNGRKNKNPYESYDLLILEEVLFGTEVMILFWGTQFSKIIFVAV